VEEYRGSAGDVQIKYRGRADKVQKSTEEVMEKNLK
jgi:hypothetical protein